MSRDSPDTNLEIQNANNQLKKMPNIPVFIIIKEKRVPLRQGCCRKQ